MREAVLIYLHTIIITCLLLVSRAVLADIDDDMVAQEVVKATEISTEWRGPTHGPKGATERSLIFVASDLRNDGVSSVAKGITQAISHLGWNLRLLDGEGSKVRQAAALNRAIALKPDGIILGGMDAVHHMKALAVAEKFGISVIGWHAANFAGPNAMLDLFTNITTDAQDAGRMAALLAIQHAQHKAKVVIFTDSSYSIAMLKANSMARTLSECEQCELLSVEDIPLDNLAQEMPKTIGRLLNQFPNQITHFLVINDLYIDFAIPSLLASGLSINQLPNSISAGDGSLEAYRRITTRQFQLATVSEPLFLQGWQIVDEFNRAFHHLPPSGLRTPIHLIINSNLKDIDHQFGVYDPNNGYRDAYLRIWQ